MPVDNVDPMKDPRRTFATTEANLLGVGLGALEAALQRYRDTYRTKDSNVPVAAATESVWWICLLDESLDPDAAVRRTRIKYRPTIYEARRDADTDGQILWALRIVRNLMTHQAVVAATTETTNFFQPDGRWISSSQYLWVPSASIVDWGPASQHERQEYENRLAQRTVPGALRSAQTWLSAEAERQRT